MSLAVISGGTLSAGSTTVTIATSTAPPSTGLILIDSEVILVPTTDAAGTTWAGCTRGYSHSVAASHANSTAIYKVHNLITQNDGVLVVYEDASPATLKYKKITVNTPSQNLAIGLTPIAHLTDSTTGTATATLIAIRSDTTAHTATDSASNFASLNVQVNALQAELEAATVVTK
jgi:hypothetical protein